MILLPACAPSPEVRIEVRGAPLGLPLRVADPSGACVHTVMVPADGTLRVPVACPGPFGVVVAGAGFGVADSPSCTTATPCVVEVVPLPLADGAWLRREDRWIGLTSDVALATETEAGTGLRVVSPATLPARWTRLGPGDTLFLRGEATGLALHPLVAGPERFLEADPVDMHRGPWPELGHPEAPTGTSRRVQGVTVLAVDGPPPGWWVVAATGGERGYLIEVPAP